MTRRELTIQEQARKAALEFPYRIKLVIEMAGGATHVAEVLQTSRTKIHEWQRPPRAGADLRLPNGFSTLCLALLTGVDLNWLFTGNGQPPVHTKVDTQGATSNGS